MLEVDVIDALTVPAQFFITAKAAVVHQIARDAVEIRSAGAQETTTQIAACSSIEAWGTGAVIHFIAARVGAASIIACFIDLACGAAYAGITLDTLVGRAVEDGCACGAVTGSDALVAVHAVAPVPRGTVRRSRQVDAKAMGAAHRSIARTAVVVR